MIVLLFLLIPIFTMGISVFIVSLLDIILKDYSLFMIIVSSLFIIVCSISLPRLIFKYFNSDSLKFIKVKDKVLILSKYVFIFLLMLISVAFSIRLYINNIDTLLVYLSILLSLICIYYFVSYFIIYNKTKFKIVKIDKVNKNVNKIYLENKDYKTYYYLSSSSDIEVGKSYNFKYNRLTNIVNKKYKKL